MFSVDELAACINHMLYNYILTRLPHMRSRGDREIDHRRSDRVWSTLPQSQPDDLTDIVTTPDALNFQR